MITIKNNVMNIKNQDTSKYESMPTIIGESAYEIAKRRGYTGSEEEWLDEISGNGGYVDSVTNADKANRFTIASIGSSVKPIYLTTTGSPAIIPYELNDACGLDASDDPTSDVRCLMTNVAVQKAIISITEDENSVFNKAVVPTISTDTLYYNGEDQSPIWFNYDKSLVTMEGSLSGVAAGTYTTTFTPKSPYRWKDGTSREVNVNWTIEKSNSSVSIDNDSVQLNRNILSQEVILTKVGDGDVDIKNSNANVANVSYDGRNILTITTNGRTDGTSTITISLNEDDNYEASEPVTIVVTAKYSTIVSWADGNDDDIDLMLSNHYDGFIDVSDYWAIGDTRKINLNTIPIISTDEENPAQEIELTIIGFKHDTLKNPINGKNRAAITVQVKNCLNTAGYMNSSSDDVTIWSNCNRREWCNSEFKNALPEYLFNLVKSVVKYSNRGCHSDFEGYETYRVHEETVDDVFMLSEWEIYGNEGFIPTYSNYYGDLVADGTQYEYLAMTTSRTKTVDSAEATWWSRTSIVKSDGKSDYLGILPNGSYTQNDADTKQGLAPAFCL